MISKNVCFVSSLLLNNTSQTIRLRKLAIAAAVESISHCKRLHLCCGSSADYGTVLNDEPEIVPTSCPLAAGQLSRRYVRLSQFITDTVTQCRRADG